MRIFKLAWIITATPGPANRHLINAELMRTEKSHGMAEAGHIKRLGWYEVTRSAVWGAYLARSFISPTIISKVSNAYRGPIRSLLGLHDHRGADVNGTSKCHLNTRVEQVVLSRGFMVCRQKQPGLKVLQRVKMAHKNQEITYTRQNVTYRLISRLEQVHESRRASHSGKLQPMVWRCARLRRLNFEVSRRLNYTCPFPLALKLYIEMKLFPARWPFRDPSTSIRTCLRTIKPRFHNL